MEQELVTLLAHLGSPRDFSEVPVVHVVQLHVGILVCFYEKVNIYIYVQYSQMKSDMWTSKTNAIRMQLGHCRIFETLLKTSLLCFCTLLNVKRSVFSC